MTVIRPASEPVSALSVAAPVLVCAFAIFLLTAMDATMKGVVIAIGVYNAILWRSIVSCIVTGGVWAARRSRLPSRSVFRLHVQRSLVVGVSIVTFFWGLARVPIAEAIALSFIAPLIALMLAALLLGERIRRPVVWASLAGLVGVAIIMAGQFSAAGRSAETLPGTVAIILSAFTYGYNLVLARRQALVAGPLEVTFFQNACLAALFLAAAPWLAAAVPVEFWPVLGVITVLSMSGQYLMAWSYGRSEAQNLIPLEYSAFIWALLFGWLFFGEVVGWTTIAGAVLIVGGCLLAARSQPRLAEPIEAAGV